MDLFELFDSEGQEPAESHYDKIILLGKDSSNPFQTEVIDIMVTQGLSFLFLTPPYFIIFLIL